MAKGLKTLAALGGLGAAAYLAGKMGKKGEDEGYKPSKEDTERDAREEAVSGALKETKASKASKEYGKSMMKKAAPKAASAATPGRRAPSAKEVPTPSVDLRGSSSAPSALRPGAKAVVEKTPGEFDRMMAEKKREAERDAAFRASMRRKAETSEIDEDSGGIGERIIGAKSGGKIKAKKYAGGGSVGGASRRADGCAMRGKTKGRMV